jgi:hypothetical protein
MPAACAGSVLQGADGTNRACVGRSGSSVCLGAPVMPPPCLHHAPLAVLSLSLASMSLAYLLWGCQPCPCCL